MKFDHSEKVVKARPRCDGYIANLLHTMNKSVHRLIDLSNEWTGYHADTEQVLRATSIIEAKLLGKADLQNAFFQTMQVPQLWQLFMVTGLKGGTSKGEEDTYTFVRIQ